MNSGTFKGVDHGSSPFLFMRKLRFPLCVLTAAACLFLLRHWTWGLAHPTLLTVLLANFADVALAPRWLVTRAIAGHWVVDSVLGRMCVSIAAAAAWGILLWIWLRARARLSRIPAPATSLSSRRRFLRAAVLDVPAGVAAFSTASSLAIEPWTIPIGRYRVPIRGLSSSHDGLRLIQITDTHLGERIPLSHLREVVAKTLALRPDLVCLTGDYIHNGKSHIDEAAGVFTPLIQARIPTVGVLGNHDWYGDGNAMAVALRAIGVVMIDNDRVFLDSTRNLCSECEAGLCLAGVGDLMEHVVEPDRAMRDVPAQMPRILLSHNPDVAELPSLLPHRVDLQLSGHTHGGQVCVPGFGPLITLSKFGTRYAAGLNKGPAGPVLTSRGIGMSILPVRFCCPPELVEVTLVRVGT